MHMKTSVWSLQIWSNFGDASVSTGEQLSEAGQMGEGQGHYREALQAYERSCSLSDSQQGDDLPGLLHNWGVGLHSLASRAQVTFVCLEGLVWLYNNPFFHLCLAAAGQQCGNCVICLRKLRTQWA